VKKPQTPKSQITEPDTGATDEPDRYTKSAPDWTDAKAPERVFFINLGVFKYGTKDKSHGAAVLLALALLVTIILVIGVGLYSGPSPWLDRVFTWLGSAFLFAAGVAVGRSSGKEESNGD
jgi:peptidoglycan/LPS O-acetylase OafA/YrhL